MADVMVAYLALSMALMMAGLWVAMSVGAMAARSDVPLVVGMVECWAE